MKSFTCTEPVLKFTHDETGDVVSMQENDTLTLPDAQVERMCSLGWGTAEGVTTGERIVGASTLTAQNGNTVSKGVS